MLAIADVSHISYLLGDLFPQISNQYLTRSSLDLRSQITLAYDCGISVGKTLFLGEEYTFRFREIKAYTG